MDYPQFEDIPQIAEDCLTWPNDHVGHMHPSRLGGVRTISIYGEDIDFNVFEDQSMSSMQPMQRFLHGFDRSSLPPGLLQANLDYTMMDKGQHMHMYHWLPTYPLRIESPDRTSISDNSSYAPPNEVRSPHSRHQILPSPMDLAQPATTFKTDSLLNGGTYASSLAMPNGNISLRDLEYNHQEPEPTVEEHETQPSEAQEEFNCSPPKPAYAPPPMNHGSDSYRYRPAQSVEPISPSDEETSVIQYTTQSDDDPDFEPSSAKASKRKRSVASSKGSIRPSQRRRKSSNTSYFSNPSKISKKHRRITSSISALKGKVEHQDDEGDVDRPFPCPFAPYGCESNFASKNEWKRHVSTQHIKLGFWRCDLCTTVDPHDDQTLYHNDFNRKDLFTQHLRRMHAAPSGKSSSSARSPKDYPVHDDNLGEHQQRCYQTLRGPPQQSSCLFCSRTFTGPGGWGEQMEHVGRHLEKDRNTAGVSLDFRDWREDANLEKYLLEEGLIARDRNGSWKIGDGKPRRNNSKEGEDDSDDDDDDDDD